MHRLLLCLTFAALASSTFAHAQEAGASRWAPGYRGKLSGGLQVASAYYHGEAMLPDDRLVAYFQWPIGLSADYFFGETSADRLAALSAYLEEIAPDTSYVPIFGGLIIEHVWQPAFDTAVGTCAEMEDEEMFDCILGEAYSDPALYPLMPHGEFSIRAMVDHSDLVNDPDPISRFLAIGYRDSDTGSFTPYAELDVDARCTRADAALLCAACQMSFSSLAQGEASLPCNDGTPGASLFIVELTTQLDSFFFGPAARAMIDFDGEAQLMMRFERSSGEDRSIHYVFDGIYEALGKAAGR